MVKPCYVVSVLTFMPHQLRHFELCMRDCILMFFIKIFVLS